MPLRSWVVSTIASPSPWRSSSRWRTSWRVRDVDARRRLVHQQQLRAAEQRPGDEHPLLLAARQLADVAVGEVADAEALEHVVDLGLLGRDCATAARRPRVRAISTHSPTVTGKFQLTVSTCGT